MCGWHLLRSAEIGGTIVSPVGQNSSQLANVIPVHGWHRGQDFTPDLAKRRAPRAWVAPLGPIGPGAPGKPRVCGWQCHFPLGGFPPYGGKPRAYEDRTTLRRILLEVSPPARVHGWQCRFPLGGFPPYGGKPRAWLEGVATPVQSMN